MFTNLKLEISKEDDGKNSIVELYMADSGDFKTSLDPAIQNHLNLPVVSHVGISGAVSHEEEDVVKGYIRPVALYNRFTQKWHDVTHEFKQITMTVGHSKLFGNPSIGSFGYLIDPLNGVLVPRTYLQYPADGSGDFYKGK